MIAIGCDHGDQRGLDALNRAIASDVLRPDKQKVLDVVPDVDHKPSDRDVAGPDKGDEDDQQVRRHKGIVSPMACPRQCSAALPLQPPQEAGECCHSHHVHQRYRDCGQLDGIAQKALRCICAPGEQPPRREKIDERFGQSIRVERAGWQSGVG